MYVSMKTTGNGEQRLKLVGGKKKCGNEDYNNEMVNERLEVAGKFACRVTVIRSRGGCTSKAKSRVAQ